MYYVLCIFQFMLYLDCFDTWYHVDAFSMVSNLLMILVSKHAWKRSKIIIIPN